MTHEKLSDTGSTARGNPAGRPTRGCVQCGDRGRFRLGSAIPRGTSDAAVASARAAFDSDSLCLPGSSISEKDVLARAITSEHGKVVWYASARSPGDKMSSSRMRHPHFLKRPLFGKCLPHRRWSFDPSIRRPRGGNHPLQLPAMGPDVDGSGRHCVGNSFFLKPSEKVPSAPLLLAEWFHEAGLPDGLINAVQAPRPPSAQSLHPLAAACRVSWI
jgi:hypothetical protein